MDDSIDETLTVGSTNTLPRCRACHAQLTGKQIWVTEKQLGLGGDFDYRECSECGAISIVSVPTDLGKYYGQGYYSFKSDSPELATGWRGWVERVRSEILTETWEDRFERRTWKRLGLPHDARILDVGCGAGQWLDSLHSRGYRNLSGIDSFLEPSLEETVPFPIQRKQIKEMDGGWDLIAYHHVLEHVPDPVRELTLAMDRLRPGGALLVRVPVADSWVRRRFETAWVQWDAPRHLWIPTRACLQLLASRLGLLIEYQKDDSVAFPLWASEGYAMGCSGYSHGLNPKRGALKTFIPHIHRAIWRWIFSAWLNWREHGDQVTIIWRKPN